MEVPLTNCTFVGQRAVIRFYCSQTALKHVKVTEGCYSI